MNRHLPLIEQPELQSWRARIGWLLVTLSIWGGWACLWRPLAPLAAWYLERHRTLDPDIAAFLDSLRLHIALVLAAGLTLVIWSLVDHRHRTRRHGRADHSTTEASDLADDFGVELPLLLRAQNTPHLVFHLAKDGRIERIDMQSRPIANDIPGAA